MCHLICYFSLICVQAPSFTRVTAFACSLGVCPSPGLDVNALMFLLVLSRDPVFFRRTRNTLISIEQLSSSEHPFPVLNHPDDTHKRAPSDSFHFSLGLRKLSMLPMEVGERTPGGMAFREVMLPERIRCVRDLICDHAFL